MDAFDTRTHLGAYLFRQDHFRPRGLVAVAELQILEGYVDASGNARTVTDKLLTVCGCLSTPEKWKQFDRELQSCLKLAGFKPDPAFDEDKYVYHTTDVMARKGKLIPDGLTPLKVQRIHREVIEIIRRNTIYRFGYAVLLDDMRQIEQEYPHAMELLFGKAGSLLSNLCFRKNQKWAKQKGYNEYIPYIFDRGDEFWGHLHHKYQEAVREYPKDELSIQNLTSENKAEFSPLQAADVVAWESKEYFTRVPSIHKVSALASGLALGDRYEMRQLHTPRGSARFVLHYRESLRLEIHDLMRWVLEEELDGRLESEIIGENAPFRDMDDFSKQVLENMKRAKLEDAKAREEKNRRKNAEKAKRRI